MVLTKEYVGYFIVNSLIADAVPKSLVCMPTFFLIISGISFKYFLGRSYNFCISSSAKAFSFSEVFSVAEDKTRVIWIPSVSTLVCDFFPKYAGNFLCSFLSTTTRQQLVRLSNVFLN